jgi:hypothetical protein
VFLNFPDQCLLVRVTPILVREDYKGLNDLAARLVRRADCCRLEDCRVLFECTFHFCTCRRACLVRGGGEGLKSVL